jgi:hypothetical protein
MPSNNMTHDAVMRIFLTLGRADTPWRGRAPWVGMETTRSRLTARPVGSGGPDRILGKYALGVMGLVDIASIETTNTGDLTIKIRALQDLMYEMTHHMQETQPSLTFARWVSDTRANVARLIKTDLDRLVQLVFTWYLPNYMEQAAEEVAVRDIPPWDVAVTRWAPPGEPINQAMPTTEAWPFWHAAGDNIKAYTSITLHLKVPHDMHWKLARMLFGIRTPRDLFGSWCSGSGPSEPVLFHGYQETRHSRPSVAGPIRRLPTFTTTGA